MTEVAVKKLQDHLGQYVERARHGETILVTDEERPVAVLSGVEESQAIRQAWELVNAGVATWSGGKPQPPADPPKIKGRPTSDVVIDDRR